MAECLWPRAIASARFVCVGVVWGNGVTRCWPLSERAIFSLVDSDGG